MATIFSERIFARFEREMGSCADQLGIPRAIFHRPDIEYSIESYFHLLDCAARNGCPDIGFQVGSSMAISDIGALGHAVGAAATVGQALNLMSRYLFVLAHANIVRVDTGQDHAIISWGYTELYEGLHQQDTELAVSFIFNIVSTLGGRAVSPLRVEFEHPRPDYSPEMEKHFGCPVLFGRRYNRLLYPKSILGLNNPRSDPSLIKALDFYLSEQVKGRESEDNLLDKVRHFIAISLPQGLPEIGSVAGILGMSSRTLQRRLARQDIIFSELVDAVRHDIAMEYVRHSEYSLTEIALMLGYSELSAFSRAYRRWAGCSPQQSREKYQARTAAN